MRLESSLTDLESITVTVGDRYNQRSNSPEPGAAFPDQMARELRQHYYASVTYTDEQVGRLLGQLDDSGYAEDTIVLFFGE